MLARKAKAVKRKDLDTMFTSDTLMRWRGLRGRRHRRAKVVRAAGIKPAAAPGVNANEALMSAYLDWDRTDAVKPKLMRHMHASHANDLG